MRGDFARIAEVAGLFLRLGLTAFGGPAAHVGIMHDEVVRRRKWLDDQRFLDLLGATQLIPGPNSTEMAIHIGFLRAGWGGLVAGGVGFALPATLIVLVLSWVYVRFGATPEATGILYGIKPVVIAIIVLALWDLGRKAVKLPWMAVVGVAVALLSFAGIHELALLFGGGLLVMLIINRHRLHLRSFISGCWPLGGLGLPALAAVPFNLPLLFFTFLKIGAVLYGSGYVLLAFLRADFVVRYGWLTDQQLIDAVAIGQVTPGPLFTTATYIGYLLGGVPGALLSTLGIFLPSFVFVALSNPLIPRLRSSPWAGGLLDGVNVASLGLMAAVTARLGSASLVDPLAVVTALVAALLLFRFKVNSTWLILGGAIVGLLKSLLG